MGRENSPPLGRSLKETTPVPWEFKEALFALGVYLVCLLVLWIVWQVGIFIIAWVGNIWLGYPHGSFTGVMERLAPVMIVLMSLFEIIFLLGSVWFFTVHRHGTSAKNIGLVRSPFLKSCSLVLFSMIIINLFNGFYSTMLDRIWKANIPEVDLVQAFGGGMIGLALAVMLGGLVTPLAEEVFFRGFLYLALRKRTGIFAAVVISSLIFGFSHLDLWLVLPITFIGVMAALLYEMTGSIYPPIALHVFNNMLAVLSFYFKK